MRAGASAANEKFCSAVVRVVLILAALNLACVLDARSSEIFDTAVRHYKAGNYLLARRRFEHLLRRDPTCWQAHYQLANTYMKLNEFSLARREYELCVKEVDSATADACRKAIALIDANSRGGGGTLSSATGSSTSGGTGSAGGAAGSGSSGRSGSAGDSGGTGSSGRSGSAGGTAGGTGTADGAARKVATRPKTLEDRVVVVMPRFGHPPVDASTVDMVKSEVNQLPDYVHSVLEIGGATISIAPNMTDKFPEALSGNMNKETFDLAQAGGRCYGRDVYLYERPLMENKKELGSLRPSGDMRNQVLHEIGHAVDDCLGEYSKTQAVLNLHSLDVSDIEPNLRKRLSYFTTTGPKGSSEACAELFSGLVGATGKDTEAVMTSFPRLKLWLRKKLDL